MTVKLVLCVVVSAVLSCGVIAQPTPLVLWHGMGEYIQSSI